MPGFSVVPAGTTYVRTFSSGNALSPGTGGTHRGRTPDIRNGTTPSHAAPSQVSISSDSGTCGRSALTGTGQCMNSSSCHRIFTAQGRRGTGQGRWEVGLRMEGAD